MNDQKRGGEATREAAFALARAEKRLLVAIAERLPRSVLPDHLTVLGMLGSIGIAVAYVLSRHDPAWLWVASAGLVVNWFGDSLDGTVARVRRIQRPRYGFYLDHLTDAFAILAVGLGLGLSPYMLLATSLAIVIAYLILSINVYLETHVFGTFRLGYNRFGPTEGRLLLIVLNAFAVLVGTVPFTVFGVVGTIFDLVGLVGAFTMTAMLLRRVAKNLRTLAAEEPPNTVKEAGDDPVARDVVRGENEELNEPLP